MISLCHININSITKHKDELLARFSQYDIISVNETNLKSERKFSLMGYNIFRNDRVGKLGGGVLLAVKQHIKCREVKFQKKFRLLHLFFFRALGTYRIFLQK